MIPGSCFVRRSSIHHAGPPNEQTALDDANDRSNPLVEARRVGDLTKIAVEDLIAAVGDQRTTLCHHTKTCIRAKHLERRSCCLEPKGHDLYRHRRMSTQAVDQLGLIDDDREVSAVGRHDFLMQQGATR